MMAMGNSWVELDHFLVSNGHIYANGQDEVANFGNAEYSDYDGTIIPARSIINLDMVIAIPSIIYDEMDVRGYGEDKLEIRGSLGNDVVNLEDISHHIIEIDWSAGLIS